jgi:hypothetical protein
MRRLLALLLVLSSTACSSEAKLGESCDEPGKTEDVCESGGICGKDTDGATRCLKLCSSDTDCPTERACNGVEGSSAKGCRLKK